MDLLPALAALAQILLIDLSLAGDNAVAVGMAAAGLPPQERKKAVVAGIAAATVLRIVFAIFAVQLLQVTGLLMAGGLLLLWVSWKMWRDIQEMSAKAKHDSGATTPTHAPPSAKKLSSAITQIIIADVSMSLDNVLAVAGVARENLWVMATGLIVSVLLMGAASALVAKLTNRYPWIALAGLVVVLYTALHMIWEGRKDVIDHFLCPVLNYCG